MSAPFHEQLFAEVPAPDQSCQVTVREMEQKLAQKWIVGTHGADMDGVVRQMNTRAAEGPAGVMLWWSAWKDKYLCRFRSNCMLHDTHSSLDAELQSSAKEEQSIEDATSNRDAEALLPFTSGINTEQFDASDPPETTEDVLQLQALLKGRDDNMTQLLEKQRQSIAELESKIKRLGLEGAAMQLLKLRRESEESVDKKSAEYEAWINPKSIRAAGGVKKMLIAEGKNVAPASNGEEEYERVRRKKMANRHEAAKAAAEALVPSYELQESIEQGKSAKVELQSLLKHVVKELAGLQSEAMKKKQESQAIVERLHKARDALEAQIEQCRELEDVLIGEDGEARVQLDEAIQNFLDKLQQHRTKKATRAAADILIERLECSRKELVVRIAKVESAVEVACSDFDARSAKAESEGEALQGNIGELTKKVDASTRSVAQAMLVSCDCAQGYLDLLIDEKSQELQNREKELRMKQEECNAMEQAMETEQYSGAFASLVDEEDRLQSSVQKCVQKIDELRKKKTATETCSEAVLTLNLEVDKAGAAEEARAVVEQSFRSHPTDVKRKTTASVALARFQPAAPQSQALATFSDVRSGGSLAEMVVAAVRDNPTMKHELFKLLRDELKEEETIEQDRRNADLFIQQEMQRKKEAATERASTNGAQMDDLNDRTSDAGSASASQSTRDTDEAMTAGLDEAENQ